MNSRSPVIKDSRNSNNRQSPMKSINLINLITLLDSGTDRSTDDDLRVLRRNRRASIEPPVNDVPISSNERQDISIVNPSSLRALKLKNNMNNIEENDTGSNSHQYRGPISIGGNNRPATSNNAQELNNKRFQSVNYDDDDISPPPPQVKNLRVLQHSNSDKISFSMKSMRLSSDTGFY